MYADTKSMSQSAYFLHDLDHVIHTFNAYANSMSHSAYFPEAQRLILNRKTGGNSCTSWRPCLPHLTGLRIVWRGQF